MMPSVPMYNKKWNRSAAAWMPARKRRKRPGVHAFAPRSERLPPQKLVHDAELDRSGSVQAEVGRITLSDARSIEASEQGNEPEGESQLSDGNFCIGSSQGHDSG